MVTSYLTLLSTANAMTPLSGCGQNAWISIVKLNQTFEKMWGNLSKLYNDFKKMKYSIV